MRRFISMPTLVYGLISGPLLFLNLIFNIFYGFCLIFPLNNCQRKQPLTTLLGFLVLWTIIYCIILIILACLELFSEAGILHKIFLMIVQYSVWYSISSYVWLNFYYFIQIVPSQCALLQWAKRNIKCTIYGILTLDGFFTLSTLLASHIIEGTVMDTHVSQFNVTAANEQTKAGEILFSIFTIRLLLGFCIMFASSLFTVFYLYGHIKNVTRSGNTFSATRLRGQLRVTITGICQLLLFSLFVSYVLFYSFSLVLLKNFIINHWLFFTVNILFITGATVTLGIGQTAFKQRIINIYKVLKNMDICTTK